MMATRKQRKGAPELNQAALNWARGMMMVSEHPLFELLMGRVRANLDTGIQFGPAGWIVLSEHGVIRCHPTRRAEPEEWAYVIAHGALHLAFGHLAGGVGKEARA